MRFFDRLFQSGENKDSVPRLSSSLTANIQQLQDLFPHASDLVIRSFQLKDETDVTLVYFEGLVDKTLLDKNLLQSLMYEVGSVDHLIEQSPSQALSVPIGKTAILSKWKQIENELFNGNSILFVENSNVAVVFNTSGEPQRAISESKVESTIYGSHVAFIESAQVNLAMIRRYLPNREFQVKQYEIGDRAPTKIYVTYLQDVVNPEILQELEDRLQQINIDTIVNTGELAEYIEDQPLSFFPQYIRTERPDKTASHILQGRIAIVVDHSSSVMVLPVTFMSFFQIVDDYSSRWILSNFIRLMRLLAFFIAISLPAVYIAMLSFHYEVIPLDLMLSLGESRRKVPFPPILEAFLMEIAVEMLREAGLRLPSSIAQTIGVVGGIVIGEAAVQANIVSNVMVVIVAVTAVASYIIPSYEMASSIRLVRFILMILASLFGMIGIAMGMFILFIRLFSIESFGIPYGSPIAPIDFSDWKDTWLRMPVWRLDTRPVANETKQLKKQGTSRESDDK